MNDATNEMVAAAVQAWNATSQNVQARTFAKSCIFGRGWKCDCCDRTHVSVVFTTDDTSKGVGSRLVAAAKSFRALVPATTRVTRAKSAEYYYGRCSRPLSTTFTISVFE